MDRIMSQQDAVSLWVCQIFQFWPLLSVELDLILTGQYLPLLVFTEIS